MLPVGTSLDVEPTSVLGKPADDAPGDDVNGTSRDMQARFEGESGRVLTRERLFLAGMHEGGLEPKNGGYVFKGERFVPMVNST